MTEFKRKAFMKEFPRLVEFLKNATNITVKRIDKNLLNQVDREDIWYIVVTQVEFIIISEGMSILETIYKENINPNDILYILEKEYSDDCFNITIYKAKEVIQPLISEAIKDAEKEVREVLKNV